MRNKDQASGCRRPFAFPMVLLALLSRGRGAGFVIGRLGLRAPKPGIKMLMCKVLMHKVRGRFSSLCGVGRRERRNRRSSRVKETCSSSSAGQRFFCARAVRQKKKANEGKMRAICSLGPSTLIASSSNIRPLDGPGAVCTGP